MGAICTSADALAFVAEHGVVMVAAKGPAPRLIEAIAGGPIAGNWWSHPRSREIYSVLVDVTASDQVLVCRLIDGKITLVHRKLWPALVRLAEKFAPERIAQVREEHTSSGHHVTREMPFPAWVPAAVLRESRAMSVRKATALFGRWLPDSLPEIGKPARRRTRARMSASK
jgi:hypothetical protein